MIGGGIESFGHTHTHMCWCQRRVFQFYGYMNEWSRVVA